MIEENELNFNTEISKNIPDIIYSDRNRIKPVLINLLSD